MPPWGIELGRSISHPDVVGIIVLIQALFAEGMGPDGQGSFQSVKSAKARSGYRVHSLPSGHGRQEPLFQVNAIYFLAAIQSTKYLSLALHSKKLAVIFPFGCTLSAFREGKIGIQLCIRQPKKK